MDMLHQTGWAGRVVLSLAVLVGSSAFLIASGWRDLVDLLIPACGDGFDSCVSGRQPSGLSWYGAAIGAFLWVALVRWGPTKVAVRVVSRTLVILSTGVLAAEYLRLWGDGGRGVVWGCSTGKHGPCPVFYEPLALTHIGLGLLIGAALAAVIAPRNSFKPGPYGRARGEAATRSLDQA
jgi:hypothetical protein